METIPCILCGKISDHIAITENGYTGRKCQDCKLIFISPRPSAAEVTHLYSDEHAVLYADAQYQFDRLFRRHAASTLTKIRKYRKPGTLLELGPGGGSFLKEARNFGYEPYGIELNPIEAQWINENLSIPCESVPLNKGSFGGKQFDIIYHKDVLSHFYDPIGVFADINKALKKDGLLVFETGNIADVNERYYKLVSQFLYPDHLFFFGEKSLMLLLEQTGFKVVDIYKEVLLLQLLLQRALWGFKDSLKDKRVQGDIKMHKRFSLKDRGLTGKRQLRLLYGYVSQYLVRLGRVLPKNGRHLKLIVVAEKNSDSKPS